MLYADARGLVGILPGHVLILSHFPAASTKSLGRIDGEAYNILLLVLTV